MYGKSKTDHQMNVSWSHGVTVKQLSKLVSWTVLRKGVCGWSKAYKSVLSILVGLELSSEVIVGLVIWVLEIVLSIRRSLPNIECDVRKRLLGLHVGDDSVHICCLALVWILNDACIEFSPWCIWAPEGSEDC